MKTQSLKRVTFFIVCALLTLPLAFILTFMLSPFWNWFEGVSGIESLGHSGPANWCFVGVYAVLFSIFVIYERIRHGRT
jgi:phosphotransferase system  glucose/maltose/N-acetylglucosamine-specific IIC component